MDFKIYKDCIMELLKLFKDKLMLNINISGVIESEPEFRFFIIEVYKNHKAGFTVLYNEETLQKTLQKYLENIVLPQNSIKPYMEEGIPRIYIDFVLNLENRYLIWVDINDDEIT